MKSNLQELKSKIANAKYFVIVEEDFSTLASTKHPKDFGMFGWAITEEEIIVWHKSRDGYNVTGTERIEFYVHPKLGKDKKLGDFLGDTK